MQDVSVYLGAAPIVDCLEKYKPNVIITTRVADAALFLGPMVWVLVVFPLNSTCCPPFFIQI